MRAVLIVTVQTLLPALILAAIACTSFAAAVLYRARAKDEAREVIRLRQLNRNLRERLGEIAAEDLGPIEPVYNPLDPLEQQLNLPAHIPPHERKG